MANIWEAAETGDLAAIQNYVDSGGDLDLVDVDGYQPLVLAAFGGQFEAVKLLLDKKADVNVAGIDGSTALHLAAQNGDVTITQLLVERGADQAALAQNSTTALWLAVQEGFTECVKVLANPDTVNILDSSDNHVLQLAISKQDMEVVGLLLSVKDIDLAFEASRIQMSALDLAVRKDNVPLARVVLQAGGKISVPPPERADDALLFWALREETSSALLQFLVDEVAVDVLRPDSAGFTPLMIAVHNRDFEAVDILLPKSNVNAQAPDGSTCLLLATQNGDLALSNALLAAKASLDICAHDGASPLFLAAQEGFAKLASHLISSKADVNMLNNDGASPLYVAAQEAHEDVVATLVRSKADANVVFRGTSTALTHAIGSNAIGVVRALCESPTIDLDIVLKDGTTPVLAAISQSLAPILRVLLNAKAEAGRPDRNGCTPLMVAVDENAPDLVQVLLGAPTPSGLDLQDNAGCSALHVAVQQMYQDPADRAASLQILRALVEAKANVNTRLAGGGTPLLLACQNGDADALAVLLSSAADPNITGDKNASPLLFAAQLGHAKVADMLLKAKANPGLALDESGTVPLFAAIRGGFDDIARKIVESGFDVNHTASNGSSALKIATVLQRTDMVQYLRLNGALLAEEKLAIERDAAVKLQGLMRGKQARDFALKERNVALRIQATFRGFKQRRDLQLQREREKTHEKEVAAITAVQKVTRAYLTRQLLKKAKLAENASLLELAVEIFSRPTSPEASQSSRGPIIEDRHFSPKNSPTASPAHKDSAGLNTSTISTSDSTSDEDRNALTETKPTIKAEKPEGNLNSSHDADARAVKTDVDLGPGAGKPDTQENHSISTSAASKSAGAQPAGAEAHNDAGVQEANQSDRVEQKSNEATPNLSADASMSTGQPQSTPAKSTSTADENTSQSMTENANGSNLEGGAQEQPTRGASNKDASTDDQVAVEQEHLNNPKDAQKKHAPDTNNVKDSVDGTLPKNQTSEEADMRQTVHANPVASVSMKEKSDNLESDGNIQTRSPDATDADAETPTTNSVDQRQDSDSTVSAEAKIETGSATAVPAHLSNDGATLENANVNTSSSIDAKSLSSPEDASSDIPALPVSTTEEPNDEIESSDSRSAQLQPSSTLNESKQENAAVTSSQNATPTGTASANDAQIEPRSKSAPVDKSIPADSNDVLIEAALASDNASDTTVVPGDAAALNESASSTPARVNDSSEDSSPTENATPDTQLPETENSDNVAATTVSPDTATTEPQVSKSSEPTSTGKRKPIVQPSSDKVKSTVGDGRKDEESTSNTESLAQESNEGEAASTSQQTVEHLTGAADEKIPPADNIESKFDASPNTASTPRDVSQDPGVPVEKTAVQDGATSTKENPTDLNNEVQEKAEPTTNVSKSNSLSSTSAPSGAADNGIHGVSGQHKEDAEDATSALVIEEADYSQGQPEDGVGEDEHDSHADIDEEELEARMQRQQEQRVREEQQTKDAAAAKMQALYHGKKGRVQAQRKKEDKAAAKVQAIARGNAARNTEIKKQAAASQMQALWRGKVAREDYEKKMDELEAAEITNMAANMLQSLVKGHLEYKHYQQKLKAARLLQYNSRFHRRRRFGLEGRRMVKEAKALMAKLIPLVGVASSVVDLEFYQQPGREPILDLAQAVQSLFSDAHKHQVQVFNAAFGEVSVALERERDERYNLFKACAREALNKAQETQEAAYTSVHEAMRAAHTAMTEMTQEYFYSMKLTPMVSRQSGIIQLRDLVNEANADVDGVVTHALSQSLHDPGFLKRAMALILFDDFCADCTTAIFKMQEAVLLAKKVDNNIQEHMRTLRKKQIAEMEKERATRRALTSKARVDPRKLQRYKRDKLNPILAPLMAALVVEMPSDIPAFVVAFLGRSKFPGVVPTPDTPEKRRFVAENLNPLLVPVLSRIIAQQPDDVAGFLAQAFVAESDALEAKQLQAAEGK